MVPGQHLLHYQPEGGPTYNLTRSPKTRGGEGDEHSHLSVSAVLAH